MAIKESKTTIDNSMHKYVYMLTIAKHQVKTYVQKEDITETVSLLKRKLVQLRTHETCYELSPKYHQLHAHIIVSTPKKVYYKDNCSINGFRLQWSPVFDIKGARNYLTKDATNQYEQEAILMENYFNNINAFRLERESREQSSPPEKELSRSSDPDPIDPSYKSIWSCCGNAILK